MRRPTLLLMLVAWSACGSPPEPGAVPASLPAPSANETAAAIAPAAAPPEPAATPAPAPPEPAALLEFTRVLEEPVHSLALGEKGMAVALGTEPWMYDGKSWKRIPLPAGIAPAEGERDEVGIYYGRDDRPRMMGTRLTADGPRLVYLRYKDGRWRREPGEIGHLAGHPPGPLYGVLGHADPEVVCKPSELCIIKRRSGWKMFKPNAERPVEVLLSNGVAWALHKGRIDRLEDDGWKTTGAPAPFDEPGGAAFAGEQLWVSEPSAGKLHVFQGGSWKTVSSPVREPRGLWAASASDVWLAGKDGAAHYDGERWLPVKGPTGPLRSVAGDAAAVWLGGASGVWRAPRPQ